jgi:RNA polymerase sigma factor (sigma-70 family)
MPSEPMTIAKFEAFYKAEWPILVKFLRVIRASETEAEDAAQKAMFDLARRVIKGSAPVANPKAWARRAAYHYFINERQHERDRMTREIKGGHLAPGIYDDHELSAVEDASFVEELLQSLTQAQREVLTRVLAGMSTREIAEDLGKREENIRQHFKNAKDQLKRHLEVSSIALQGCTDADAIGIEHLVPASEAPEEVEK